MPQKFLTQNAGVFTEVAAINASAGAGDAGKIPGLDSAGRLDTSMMPVGISADTASIQATEALSAGDLVNVYNVSGSARCRKADASTTGKQAHGFVLAAVSSGANATVYFEGSNTQVTGLTPGVQFLSAATPGLCTATAPSTGGQIVQEVGIATSATNMNTEFHRPIVLV